MDDARIDSVVVTVTNSSETEVGSGSLTKQASNWQGDITVSELGDLTFSVEAK